MRKSPPLPQTLLHAAFGLKRALAVFAAHRIATIDLATNKSVSPLSEYVSVISPD